MTALPVTARGAPSLPTGSCGRWPPASWPMTTSPPSAVHSSAGMTGVVYSNGVALRKRSSSAWSTVIVVVAVTPIGPTTCTRSFVFVAEMASQTLTGRSLRPS